MNGFVSADILLPRGQYLEKWPVIACDQFTSDPAYWRRMRERTRGVPSAMHLILPEAELGTPEEAPATRAIHRTMERYLAEDVFVCYPDAYVYVERTLCDGSVRPGLVGAVDLERYDYRPGSQSPIRATERTVLERIPPRERVRRDAALELPHVLMLCDDAQRRLVEPLAAARRRLPALYDLELPEGGGRIRGWLVQGRHARAFDRRFAAYTQALAKKYPDLSGAKVLLAVGDGNHSLATAKSCYEQMKQAHPDRDFSRHPARFALVELENIHDPSLRFEPIHRVVLDTEPERLLADLASVCAPGGYPVRWCRGDRQGTLSLDPRRGELAVAVLQDFLDRWLADHLGRIDYIHGEAEVQALSRNANALGLLLPAMGKQQLFRGVISGGILPRKTFSMGHAREKRYYLEGRKIK